MKNLRMAAKLVLSFSLIVILSVTIGVVGVVAMKQMSDASTFMYDYCTVPIADLSHIIELLQRMRVSMRDYAIGAALGDMDKVQSAHAAVLEYQSQMTGYMDNYDATILDDEDNVLFDEVCRLYRSSYLPYLNEAYQRALEGDSVGVVDVITRATDDTLTMTDNLNACMNINQTASEDEAANTAALYSSQMILLVAVIAVSVILAVIMTIFVSGAISKPIARLRDAADKVAEGDTGIKLQDMDRTDEIGQLSQAFDRMIKALRAMSDDAGMLVDAAEKGSLSVRADASKHKGDYKKIVEGVNHTLDLVIAPVQKAAEVLAQLSQGNLNVRVDGQYHGDHALIQSSLNSTIDSLKTYIGEINQVLGEMAEGNFNVGITGDFRGNFVALKDAINRISDSLNEVLTGINAAAEQVLSGTQQVSDGAQNVSQGATEQASSIEELTATVTQIAEQTRQNAQNATENSRQAMAIKQIAEEGNERMRALQAAMAEINAASANISKIVKEIDNIAFQTNILALNAAVEAAHAGSYGQGFAVVAEEVRSLADKSAAAAKDTTALIEDSIRKTEIGSQIANETAQSLEKIVEGVAGATEVITQIAQASNEQASGVAQVNKGIEQMSQVVQTNSAVAEQSAALAQELSGQADLLKQMVSKFELRSSSRIAGQGFAPRQSVNPAQPRPQIGTGEAGKMKIVLNDTEFGKY